MIVQPSNRVAKVETYYFATKLMEIADLNAKGEDIINLGIGSPDLAPPSKVLESLTIAMHDKNANKYQSYKGIPQLRAAFAGFYKKHYNVTVDPSTEILPLIGSKEGIMHISMTFLDDGDQVLIPNPGYPSYASATKLAGGVPLYYDLTDDSEWLPDFKTLEKANLDKVKLMWINYPHMPTGKIANLAFYKELVAFAERHKILICHDNPYSFILNDNPLSIFQIEGAMSCCLELNSLSKTFNMAGWRVGAVIGQKDYIDHVMRFKSNMDSGMYKPVQIAACEALSQDDDWFDHINSIYKKRRKKVWKIMDLLECKYSRNAVGMFVWAKPERKQNIKDLVDRVLYEAKVFITPGFIFGSNGDEYIRISLCCDESNLDTAIQRIATVVDQKLAVS